MLAVSVDSFAKYQREDAWTWEHMALTRARVIYGTEQDRAAVDAVITRTLAKSRDQAQLTADVVTMRGEMAAHQTPSGGLDVKLLPSGLVDLEFVVHFYHLLNQEAFDPRMPQALIGLASAGLVDARLGEAHEDRTSTRLNTN